MPGEIEQAAQRVRRHRLDDHHALAAMVMRLTRWLDRPPLGDAEFRALAEAHVTDQASSTSRVRTAYGRPGGAGAGRPAPCAHRGSRRARRDEDLTFAARLASFVGHAAPGGPILGVEEVLDRVVAPIAEQRPCCCSSSTV